MRHLSTDSAQAIAPPCSPSVSAEPADERLPDISPSTSPAALDRSRWVNADGEFTIAQVAPLVGMSQLFIRRTTGQARKLTAHEIVGLLDQDAYRETFVPRSHVLDHLVAQAADSPAAEKLEVDISDEAGAVVVGEAKATLARLAEGTVQCLVTSPPYWAVRVYDDSTAVHWADGERCAYGHEQTPEGYVRHTVEMLHLMRPLLRADGSIWWNVMDTYNTRTRLRRNAAERVRSMRSGRDSVGTEHEVRRYSAGHAYLQDGELCLIPGAIAERASRIGYRVKSMVNWAKHHAAPDPQGSRVGRGSEVILHLSTQRTPKFHKNAYKDLVPAMGGRDHLREPDRSSDTWMLPPSSGQGHGAQFPLALPARCIALSSDAGDLVMDPFCGYGTTGVAARRLGRRFVGIEISPTYAQVASESVAAAQKGQHGRRFRPALADPSQPPML